MKLTLLVSSILAAAASLNAATITVGTQPLNFSGFAPVVLSAGGLIANGSGFVAIGSTTLSDSQVGAIGTTSSAYTSFLGNFKIFGTSTTFGGSGVFDEPSLFSFTTSASTTTGDDFVSRAITLVAGNGSSLANSTQLFIYKFGGTFGADAPLFTADVDLKQSGTVLFGGTQDDIALPAAGTHDGFKMALVVPEPSAALLGAFGALGLLRRRRA